MESMFLDEDQLRLLPPPQWAAVKYLPMSHSPVSVNGFVTSVEESAAPSLPVMPRFQESFMNKTNTMPKANASTCKVMFRQQSATEAMRVALDVRDAANLKVPEETLSPTSVLKTNTGGGDEDESEATQPQLPRMSKPKRALSAYNLFFRAERIKIVGEESDGPAEAGSKKRKRRPHRKTHGKIGFTDLAKLIAQKWKGLDAEEKVVFEQLASKEVDRYKIEMVEYRKAVKQSATEFNECANPFKKQKNTPSTKTMHMTPSVLAEQSACHKRVESTDFCQPEDFEANFLLEDDEMWENAAVPPLPEFDMASVEEKPEPEINFNEAFSALEDISIDDEDDFFRGLMAHDQTTGSEKPGYIPSFEDFPDFVPRAQEPVVEEKPAAPSTVMPSPDKAGSSPTVVALTHQIEPLAIGEFSLERSLKSFQQGVYSNGSTSCTPVLKGEASSTTVTELSTLMASMRKTQASRKLVHQHRWDLDTEMHRVHRESMRKSAKTRVKVLRSLRAALEVLEK